MNHESVNQAALHRHQVQAGPETARGGTGEIDHIVDMVDGKRNNGPNGLFWPVRPIRTLIQFPLIHSVQGDTSGCSLGFVDIKIEVAF